MLSHGTIGPALDSSKFTYNLSEYTLYEPDKLSEYASYEHVG